MADAIAPIVPAPVIVPAPPLTAPGADGKPDPKAEIDALKKTVDDLKASADKQKADAEKAVVDAAAAAAATAKADADAKLSAAQLADKQKEERIAALEKKLADTDTSSAIHTRANLLASLGVPAEYHLAFPAGDARDPAVKAAIEKFATDHPNLVSRSLGVPQPKITEVEKKFAASPRGKVSQLVDPATMRASYASLDRTLEKLGGGR